MTFLSASCKMSGLTDGVCVFVGGGGHSLSTGAVVEELVQVPAAEVGEDE